MNTHDDRPIPDADDLLWLADHRPDAGQPDPTAAARARTALLTHVERSMEATTARPVPTAPAAAPRRTRRSWGRRTVAVGALAAVVVAVGIATLPSGGGGPVGALSPSAAEAAPLVRLTRSLSAAPQPTGDASLTVRRIRRADGSSSVKYDLILDHGFVDFFGETQEDLRAAKADTDPAYAGTGTKDRGTLTAWIAAAAGAAGATPDQAAAALEGASGIPIVDGPDAATREILKAKGRTVPPPSNDPADRARERRRQYDNHVWTTALSVLEVGAGRPDVRAGALAAMSGVGARTEEAADGDRKLLRVSMPADSGDRYVETLTIDATTGIPVRFTGGPDGGEAEVTTTYDVSRVDAADLGH